MKFLLVLALALVASAEEVKEEQAKVVYPYAYATPYLHNYYHAYPQVYNYQPYYHHYPYYNPVKVEHVEKEYEVQVKSFEFVEPKEKCLNYQGAFVPCKQKRDAPEEEEEKKIIPLSYGYPFAYNLAHPYTPYTHFPYAYSYAHPYYHAYGPCQNNKGEFVPCRVTRSADEEEEKPAEEEKKIIPLTYGYPYYHNYYHNSFYPYHYPYTTAYVAPKVVEYKAPEPITYKVEVPKPVFKKVVQKIPVVPACRNGLGYLVPCADNE